MRRAVAILLAPLLAACSVLGMRSTEEPAFTSIARVGEVEIRRYAPRLVAEVVMPGDEATARNRGFRPLAAYIFGENRASERIGMTAPVAQAGAQGGERIGMTAPVTQAAEGGQWRIGFFMPARYTRETLPAPTDPAITIRELPPETLAVLRFSGLPSEDAVQAARASLDAALAGTDWRAAGPGGAWFFDPPWTVPALRRSEAWVPVRPASTGN
jgi:hypothetical protein